MDRYRAGMLARAKAGRDAGKVYVIIRAEGAYVYLADGKIRTINRAKKKKIKHIQLICRENDISQADDAQIRRILKDFNREEEV